jgi:hypothetical protein
MRVLMFGSRSLSWKHLPVFRALALHATLSLVHDECGGVPPMSLDLMRFLMAGGDDEWQRHGELMALLNGDGPPGKDRGAVGADKLALLACMEAWPETMRRVRWFKPEELQAKQPGVSWAQAAAMRDVAMAEARPDRAYVVHTDLDSSRGSIITARALTERGLPFWYCRVTPAGALVSVEERRP